MATRVVNVRFGFAAEVYRTYPSVQDVSVTCMCVFCGGDAIFSSCSEFVYVPYNDPDIGVARMDTISIVI